MMETVLVEFEVGPERTDACVAALTALMQSVVSKQPAFHGATIHVETATGTVINVMRWDRAADFVAFRDSNSDVIGPAIGQFQPRGRMLTIAAEIASQS